MKQDVIYVFELINFNSKIHCIVGGDTTCGEEISFYVTILSFKMFYQSYGYWQLSLVSPAVPEKESGNRTETVTMTTGRTAEVRSSQ